MAAPVLDLDFYGEDARSDPAGLYREMLSAGPVVWLARHDIHAIVGFEALTATLRNHRIFQSGQGVSINPDVNKVLVGSTLNSDPPDHDMTRRITFQPLTPKALQVVRDRIEKEAERIVGQLVTRGGFDAAAELAPHLPLTIVRDLVGLGGEGGARMLDWGAATFELMGDPRDRAASATQRLREMRTYLDDPKTLAQLHPDGWARSATARGVAAGLPETRAVELMRDYIAPSLDTTISAIGFGVMLFARNPDEWTRLRGQPDLLRGAIEEIVRLNTPIRAFTRHVAEDIDVADVGFAAGERVMVVYGAANRDPARFADPDRFDIGRDTRGHVGFGHGVHACLGMHLARLEMTAIFTALMQRVVRFELAGPCVPAVNSTIRAFSEVPVTVMAV